MTTTRIVVVAALALGLVAATVVKGLAAGAPPEFKCASTKQKAAAKKEKSKIGCWATAASKNLPAADPACLTKAEMAFHATMLKAGGGCADPGDGLADPPAPIEGAVDTCVTHVAAAFPYDATTAKCSNGKLKASATAASAELTCYAKAAAKPGLTVDPNCVPAAQAKLEAALTKADGTAHCPGNAGAVESAISGFCVTTIANQLPPKPPGCGDGVVEPGLSGETCDSGATNGNPGDPCPSGCVIQACTPVSGSSRAFDVQFTPPSGKQVTGITVNLDYPEGKVSIPGSGMDQSVQDSITHVPFGAFSQPNDTDWALLETIAKASPITPGRLFTITFQDCQGATAPTAADFKCTVTDASDNSNPPQKITGVTCTVVATP